MHSFARSVRGAASLLAVLLIAGCAATEPVAAPTSASPASQIPGCPAAPRLDSPPETVLTLDTTSAAFLIELGLEDRIIGTASRNRIAEYPEEIRQKLDRIPVVAEGGAPKEVVIAAEPDLVVATSVLQLDGVDGAPSFVDLERNDIAVLAACGIGTTTVNDISATYEFVSRIADVFDVEQTGADVIEGYRTLVDDARSDAQPLSVLILSGAPDGGAGIQTSGGFAFANGIVTLAGGHNIAEAQNARFASLSAEQVALDDPELIIAMSGFSEENDEELVRAIRQSPLLQSVSAVRTGAIVVVPSSLMMTPHPLNAVAVTRIAEAIDTVR